MPINDQGVWVPRIFSKQGQVYNDNHRYLLISGPRKSGKSLGALHKVCRHLWETPNACVGAFARTIKSAKDFGMWSDLTRIVMPEWLESGIGYEYLTTDTAGHPGPKIDNQTRTLYFKVRNYYGGESELKLYSLDCCEEVEAKVKSMRFSMIYFSELGNFDNPIVFTATVPQLRMLPPTTHEQHQWIADCNPTEEGEDSWIYKLFYGDRTRTEFGDLDETEIKEFKDYQKDIGLIEIFTADNPYLTDRDKREIKTICHHDQALYERYVNGLWVKGGNMERHFANVFKQNIHVIGDIEAQKEEDWNVALPSAQCSGLIAGWDLGETNHAAHIIEKVVNSVGELEYFTVLDELVYIGEEVSTEDFTLQFMEKMKAQEAKIGRPVPWVHWSDEQALKQWKSGLGGVDALVVRNASKGKIELQGVPKEPESVRRRVQILKRLLAMGKIYISAHCVKTIEMLTELRRHKKDFVQRTSNPHKHPFDSLTYALSMEVIYDLEEQSAPKTGSGSGLVLCR